MSQITYGHLKERVLDCLFEHEEERSETVLLDNARSAAISKMPDVVSSCLVRMFETLSVGRKKAQLELAASEKEGFFKAQLPADFGRVESESLAMPSASDYYISEGYLYVSDGLFHKSGTVEIFYRALPPVITSETDESFEIGLSLLAIEALVCLCALELCGKEDNSLYTRLYYKYSDLCMGLCEPLPSARRNGFFAVNSKKRWTR